MASEGPEETELTPNNGPAVSEAFRVHFNDLIVAIQDPEIIACALYSVNIISSGLMSEVGMIALSPVQKKMKLLSAVGDKLQVEPEKFEHLMTVLQNNSPSLRDVAEKLEETYKRFSSRLVATVSSVQHARTGTYMFIINFCCVDSDSGRPIFRLEWWR